MKFLLLTCALSLPTFATKPRIENIAPVTSYFPKTARLLDIDGDGDLDFVGIPERGVSDNHISFFENLGAEGFSPAKSLHYLYGPVLANIGIGDRNGDLKQELYLITSNYSQFNRNGYFLWGADPIGNESQSDFELLASWENQAPLLLDLDGTGAPEFLLFDQNERLCPTIHQLDENGNTSPWSSQVIKLTPQLGTVLEAEGYDLDGDGDRDLILTSEKGTLLFERIGENEFAETPVVLDISSFEFSDIIDINQDGKLDLLGSYSIARQEANFTFSETPVTSFNSLKDYSIEQGSEAIFSARVNSLDEVDTVTVGEVSYDEMNILRVSNEQLLVLPGIPKMQLSNLYQTTSTFLEDLDGDESPELFVIQRFLKDYGNHLQADITAVTLNIYTRINGSFELLASSQPSIPLTYDNLIAKDFDQDEDVDLLTGPDINGNFSLLLNDGEANFTEALERVRLLPNDVSPDEVEVSAITAVKFNDDNYWDIGISYRSLSPNPNPETRERFYCTIALGNGQGAFSIEAFPDDAFSSSAATACGINEFVDWDRDGDLDAMFDGGWRENINGVLESLFRPLISNVNITNSIGNSIPLEGSVIGDVDGDGSPDYMAPFYKAETMTLPNEIPTRVTTSYDIGIAFNDGNGGISEVRTYPGLLRPGPTTSFGDPALAEFGLIDTHGDDRARIFIPIIDSDPFGNPIYLGYQFLQVPAANPRDLRAGFLQTVTTRSLPLQLDGDFNGDEKRDYPGDEFYWEPTPQGLAVSPSYDFTGLYDLIPLSLLKRGLITLADFDGDGDIDRVETSESRAITLVRNLLVDERSPIMKSLRNKGLTPLAATPTSDPDEDGLTNEEEFLRGTDPQVADAQNAVSLDPAWNGTRLSFLRRRETANFKLSYGFERSRDLINWEPVPLDQADVNIVDDTWEEVQIEGVTGESRYYYRTLPRHTP